MDVIEVVGVDFDPCSNLFRPLVWSPTKRVLKFLPWRDARIEKLFPLPVLETSVPANYLLLLSPAKNLSCLVQKRGVDKDLRGYVSGKFVPNRRACHLDHELQRASCL